VSKPKRTSKRRQPQYGVELEYDSSRQLTDLAPYAEALLALYGNQQLDEALTLAHNINTSAHQFDLTQSILLNEANELRMRLAELEERLRAKRDI
jgi:hypothetical protein